MGHDAAQHVENPKNRAIFLQWHDELAFTQPQAADNKLSAIARAFSWGYDRGHLTQNPIATIERAYGSSRSEPDLATRSCGRVRRSRYQRDQARAALGAPHRAATGRSAATAAVRL